MDGLAALSAPVSVSILLRLLPAISAEPDVPAVAHMRGQAEVVETGETVVFKDSGEMLAFLMKVTHRPSTDPEEGPGLAT